MRHRNCTRRFVVASADMEEHSSSIDRADVLAALASSL
jgi:hypothetical protein